MTPLNERVREWMQEKDYDLVDGYIDGSLVYRQRSTGDMLDVYAARWAYLASLQAQKDELEKLRTYDGYFSVGFASFISDREAELDKLMETDRQPNNIQEKD